MRLARFNLVLLALSLLTLGTGCVQEKLVIPVATVTGKIVVPPAKDPLGVKVSVAGNPGISTYVNERGEFKLEFRTPGRYLLVCRGQQYDVDFVWVDAVLEETVSVGNVYLSEKIVGEAKWIATIVDFPDATGFKVKSLDPRWATDTIPMYDDGTHGDKIANDGIYTTRAQNLYTGSQLYSIIWMKDTEANEVKDPHREFERNGKSEIIVREPDMKVARGTVTSALTGVNYSEVVLATKMGARKINVDSDGKYAMPMEGNGKEYLVFRSPSFHIRAIPVDLTTMPIYDVPPVTLAAKGGGEAKFILIKSDFQEVVNPTVVADFTNWQPQALYDDGTNGDEVAGDGVYTRLFTRVAPGYHKYAFNITATNQVRDPYQESGDSQYSILLVK
ncbi:MAG: hypothetical protein OZSIB_0518 [Candidatus Ozemobacter sibiricus]|jgi:hypothetical protein|uniref:Carboxypeptidase regulatory-like domain-containing protein n=1 Tax=Candidatus Ozemobacter sibiricus TaxID=2268124 RepID=A0A367ZM94_9BACT|nr:MAG: hypothetical protein OZSIB_0518 [Candidatus Ozemobacter sibiricus]